MSESQPATDPDIQSGESPATKARRGVVLGLASAVGYSAANLALRDLSGQHEDVAWAIWVSAMKALPTFVLAAALLVRRRHRGETLYPTTKPIPALIVAALVMQFGGNLGFQLALGHIGLAISVPIVFAFIIAAGAILGRIFLGDGISRRTIVAVGVMMSAIILLSYAATLANPSDASAAGYVNRVVWLGILIATVSGISYGINGVVIRGVVQKTMPVESMLLIYSGTGLVFLSALGVPMMGQERMLAITAYEWLMMLVAGTFNAVAFLAVTHALKLLNVTHVNVINATQNAMCAIGAVLIFAEPNSPELVLGVVLSIVGLVLLGRPER